MARKKGAGKKPAQTEAPPLDLYRVEPIPLNQLDISPANARKVYSQADVESMARSIERNGVIQNLLVEPGVGASDGKFFVVGGGMRLRALKLLAERSVIAATSPVNCAISVGADSDGRGHVSHEISLVENIERYQMDPVDEAEAFAREAANGETVPFIAAKFGRDERFVKQRLKLAAVNPKLLDLYREGKLPLECVQAFTLSEDHAEQWAAWDGLGAYYKERPGREAAESIRLNLSTSAVRGSDRRVAFVGLKAYQKAGGRIQEDLFSARETTILDVDLLDRLVNEKLEAEAAKLRSEGWASVQPVLQRTHEMTKDLLVVSPEVRLTPEQEARQTELEEEHRQLEEELDDDPPEEDEGAEVDPRLERMEAVEKELQELEEAGELVYPEGIREKGTVFASLGRDGKLEMQVYQPREERLQVSLPSLSEAAATSGNGSQAAPAKSPYSRPLIESLTTHKTAAIAAELMQKPDVALASVLYGMLLGEDHGQTYSFGSAVQVSGTRMYYKDLRDQGIDALAIEWKRWTARIPKKVDQWWDWCVGLPQQGKLQLLAVLAARCLNGLDSGAYDDKSRVRHLDQIGRTLGADPSKWFEPDRENFYSKVPKSVILAAIEEAGKPGMIGGNSIKKADVVEYAEDVLRGSGWIPEPVRIPDSDAASPVVNDDEFEELEPVEEEELSSVGDE